MKLNEIKYLPKSNAFADVYSKATGMPFVGEMMVAAAGQGGDSPEPEPEPTPTPTPLNEWLIPVEVINLLAAQAGSSLVFTTNPQIWEGDTADLIVGIDFSPIGWTKTAKLNGEVMANREEVSDFDGFEFTAEVAAAIQQYTGIDVTDHIGQYVLLISPSTQSSELLPTGTYTIQGIITKDGVSYSTGTYTANWTLDDNEVE